MTTRFLAMAIGPIHPAVNRTGPSSRRAGYPKGRNPHPGIPGNQPERQNSSLSFRGWAGSVKIQRHPVPFHRGHRLLAGRSLRPGAGDEWLFWEQYTQEPNVAISSFLRKHRKLTDEAPYSLMPRKRRERPALTLMETHLSAGPHLLVAGQLHGRRCRTLHLYPRGGGRRFQPEPPTRRSKSGSPGSKRFPISRQWVAPERHLAFQVA